MKNTTKKLTISAVLSALSLVSLLAIKWSILPQVPFLEYDFADVFVFLGTFMYGPVVGIVITSIVSMIQAFTMGGGIYGAIMHILATGSFVVVAGLMYSKRKTLKRAIISMATGVVTWVVVMIGANLLITPLFMGTTVEVVWGLMLYIVLFNVIKSVANSTITLVLYKRVRHILMLGEDEIQEGIIFTDSERQTYNRAREIGKRLKAGDVVLLNGDLGAGKTVFTKGVCSALKVRDNITSPTFNIVKEYQGTLPVYHFDMYRLDEDEAESMGLEEYFDKGGVCLIEWNRLDLKGRPAYVIDIEKQGNNARKIKVQHKIIGE